ncbi:MAG: hypothetical protein Q4D76_14675 [Oscillospiraceae bacterium]|nr:hypothetical protein [Oscillospiraceae bacterium]
MVLLFEDNPNTPSSRLFKSCLFGDNIYFSNGNHNLAAVAANLANEGNSVIVFVDVSVNSIKTKMVYNALAKRFKDDEHILVLPIICIEYYILRMLCNHGFLDFVQFQTKEMQSLLQNFVVDITGEPIDKSLEKQYKHILSEIGNKKHCYINRMANNGMRGRFYMCDCPCTESHCTDYKKASIGYKAESLYSTLPVFFVDEAYRKRFKELGLNSDIHSTDLKDTYNSLVKLYTKLQGFYGDGNSPLFRFNYNFRQL